MADEYKVTNTQRVSIFGEAGVPQQGYRVYFQVTATNWVDFIEVPLIGHVAAGIPLFAEENWDGVLKVSTENLSPGKHFALRVQGDSMEGAGILDGDIAIFEQRQDADNGDIIVALLNDEAVTLKRFYKEKNRIKLKSENPIYPPIYTQNVRVLGKLTSITRNYD